MSVKKIKNTEEMHSRLQEIPIAIIGMSSIFPQAKNIQDFWDNIINEVDCIIDVPPSRWSIDDYYDPDPTAVDKTYCKRGGFIPDIDFDPMEFGLPPNILEVTDVHQLLSLITAKNLLRDGGYENATDEQRENMGVILGVGGGQKMMVPLISRLQYPIWERVLKSSGVSDDDTQKIVDKIKKAYVGWEENAFPGALGNIIAGRIANRLNLGGTNCVVDAACASAFSGIRMAISELLEYRAETMISGGVDTDNSLYMYLCFSKTQAFSHGEKSQPFDKDSAGMLIGEGIGMVLLKRLEDAERDKDRIYAVIKGIGSSSDGRFKSIYAPRPEGQILALKRAYKDAGIEPSTIGMIEAHGTGTIAGDVAEISALKTFYNEHDSKKQHIALGSVKSQIGHLKNAAGSAGIIKTALALYHKVIPATINITEPNKEFELEDSPFYLNTAVRPWFKSKNDPPRRAAISAFGFGGTNFHYVLEEYGEERPQQFRIQKVAQEIIITAQTPAELLDEGKKILEQLKSDLGKTVFYELITRDKQSPPLEVARVGFVAKTPLEAAELLEKAVFQLTENIEEESWELPQGIFYRKKGIDPKGKVVALFAGQGSPYVNMGKELVCNFPPLMESQTFMDDLFIDDGLEPLSKIVYPNPSFDKGLKKAQDKTLQMTENAQPAIGVFSAGQHQIMKKAGFKPDFVAGHSFGELTALWAAEVLSDEDYFTLAKARGKAMAAPDDPDFDAGSMLAVMGDVENLENDIKAFPTITIANLNSGNQIVLAGPKDDIGKVQKALKKKKYRAILLGVSAAFHTKLVGHAQKPFAEAIKAAKFNKPKCTVFSNASAKAYPSDPKIIQKTLQEHILNSVLFKDEINNIYDSGGYYFIEFGPKNILTKLVENILENKPYISVAFNGNIKKESDRQFREAVVKLKVSGLSLGDIDPYLLKHKKVEKKKTAMTLKLSGTNYVSEKTRLVFEDALNDGHKIQSIQNVTKNSDEVATKSSPSETTMKKNESTPVKQENISIQYPLESIERSMTSFNTHQNETLKIHEQFLNSQAEYSRSFFQIMQQQAQAGPNSMSKEVADSISQFHNHQRDTLRIHEQYLNQQNEYSKNSFELVKQQQALLLGGHSVPPSITVTQTPQPQPVPAPQPVVAPAPVNMVPPVVAPEAPMASAGAIDKQTLTKTLLKVVSEKTGYQSEMLELNMDMEADLGIDSIKRVEILNGIQEKLPDLPQVNPEELSELRTLEQIINHMMPHQDSEDGQSASEVNQVAEKQSGTIDKDTFATVLLSIVSEKTGYQAEMLELNMDMEADLGIDSIKRVEILNGIQEKLPDLPTVNPEELSELRTLGQIVDHMISQDSEATEPGQNENQPTQATSTESTSVNSGFDMDLLAKTLLEVVSEKTGYLADMLELSMDMEADLGIDSIKRVEILNGMQEKLPDLPEINPEELTELRTLEQIVSKMGESVPKEEKKKRLN